jgi:NAD-dependent dihydropyrimidine dehydrogenase PreA subunit
MIEAELRLAIETALSAQVAASTSLYSPVINSREYPCDVAGCTRQGYSGGYCNAHYIRMRKGADMSVPLRARKRDDLCAECGEATGAKGGWGLCSKHYKRKRINIIKSALVGAMGGKCLKCNGVYPNKVFDFHHVEAKDDSASYLISTASPRRIAAEVSKCVLLCANCHRMEHFE